MNFLNLLLNAYLLKNKPISLVHFITNRCNARCAHCFIDFADPEIFKDELSLPEMDKLTRSLDGLFNVNLTGGEPFLRNDIFEIASLYFRNARVNSIFITTNGAFTEKIREFVEKFLVSGIKGKLIFSLSIDDFPKHHDFNRQVKGMFKKALRTYKMIKSYNDYRVIANIGITVTPNNAERVVSLYFLLKRIGIDSFTATIMREEGIVKKMSVSEKETTLDAYKKLVSLIHQSMIDKQSRGFNHHLEGALMNSKNIILNRILCENYVTNSFISYCTAGSLFGVIYANGDVYPCEILGNRKLGNLRDFAMDFMKLWQSDNVRKFKEFVKKTKCRCTYECAWTMNIISDLKFMPSLLLYTFGFKKWKKKKSQ